MPQIRDIGCDEIVLNGCIGGQSSDKGYAPDVVVVGLQDTVGLVGYP